MKNPVILLLQLISCGVNNEFLFHKNVTVSGRVQGVGFRYAAKHAAISLDIKGFVRNLPNGDVYLEAEGYNDQLNSFIAWCHQGPIRAVVKNVLVYDGPVARFNHFEVR
jgi:acylphosphatase